MHKDSLFQDITKSTQLKLRVIKELMKIYFFSLCRVTEILQFMLIL